MAEQLLFPYYVNQAKFEEFLSRVFAIENEQERLRAELKYLAEEYAHALPVKPTLVQLGIVRKRRKLARKEDGAMTYEHQDYLRAKIEAHLDKLEQEIADLEDLTRGESE